MSYPFVASHVRLGRARGPRLALVVHMAEGGGTVGYLSRPNPNGVAVHFVIEYSGRTVQMLELTEMGASIRASAIRASDDPDGFYGRSHALAVMGVWADTRHGTPGPNHASIQVEVEGFARSGPNPAQNAALAALYLDLRTRYPGIRSLGHRDFASYKACPGRSIAWRLVGGHGRAVAEPPVPPRPPARPERTLEDDVVIVETFPSPRSAVADEPVRSFTFDVETGVFRELGKVAAGTYSVDATVRFLRETSPKGLFVRLVTGPTGRRLVSAGSVDLDS